MATDINSVTITGRLTKNAESKSSQSGANVVLFSIATNYYKKDASNNEEVSYLDCVTFRADRIFQYLKKGTQVVVNGLVRQKRWESNGQKMSKVEIVAEAIKLVGSNQSNQANQANQSRPAQSSQAAKPQSNNQTLSGGPEDFDDDIPF